MAGLLDNPVFPYFAFYSAIVVLKTMAMAVITSVQRYKHKAFINPEDSTFVQKKGEKPIETVAAHPYVERVRRCHLNDLENVIPFVLIGLLYVSTGPNLSTALLHFRIFTGARIFHTIAYLLPLPQPSRGLSFNAGFPVTVSMAVNVLYLAKY